jgi:hypothetical protein
MVVSGQLHVPATLPLGKGPWYPMNRRVGASQTWSGGSGKEKKSCGLEVRHKAAVAVPVVVNIINYTLKLPNEVEMKAGMKRELEFEIRTTHLVLLM